MSCRYVGIAYFDQASLRAVPSEPVTEFPLLVQSHPRLYFTADDLPAIRAKANDNVNAPLGMTGKQIWDVVEQQARLFLAETSFTVAYYGGHQVTYQVPTPMPEPMDNPPGYTSGRYPYWTMMSTSIQTRVETLSWAYAVTGEEPFADKAKQYVLALAEWETWSDPTYGCAGVTCLDTAHLTIASSTAYDILYDRFTPAERAVVEQAIEEKGLIPLWTDTQTGIDTNLLALRASALGTGGSVLLGKSPEAHKYLTRAVAYYRWYFDTRMQSGEQEGHNYTSYSVDNILRAVDHVSRTTGMTDLIDHPFLNDFLVRWVAYFLAPGGAGLASFSDSAPANYYVLSMSIINHWLDNGLAGWYLKETKAAEASLNGFIYMNPHAVIEQPGEPTSAVLDEIGWAALRSGWAEDDTLLAFVSNNSRMGHNQYDQNSFQMATNRSWPAGDPGYRDYVPGPVRDFTERLGHSTVQVDGRGQSRLGGGVLDRGMLSPTYDYVVGSAAEAYESPNLTRFDRHIVFVKPDYYVIFDDLAADAPRVYDWILYSGTITDFAIDDVRYGSAQTAVGDELRVRNGKAELGVKFLQGEPVPITVTQYPGAERFGYYAKISSGDPATAHQFLTVLKAGPSAETGLYEEADLLPPADSSGREYRIISAAGKSLVFYRGQGPGDYITFRVTVPADGAYTLTSQFIQSPLYGRFQAYVDGEPLGEAFDGYNAFVQAADPWVHGTVQLTAGEHFIRYEIVGQNAQSGGFLFGLDALKLEVEHADEQDALGIDAERIEGTNAVGAKVFTPAGADAAAGTDLVLFNTGLQSFEIAGATGDARQAVVRLDASDRTIGFSMTHGTALAYGQRTLLQGTAPFNAAFDADTDAGRWRGTVESSGDQTLSFHASAGAVVAVNGEALDPGSYAYDAVDQLVTLTIGAGTSVIEVWDLPGLAAELHRAGDLAQPLFVKLLSSSEQAEHHWQAGRREQASKHWSDVLKHMDNEATARHASEAARERLTGATLAVLAACAG